MDVQGVTSYESLMKATSAEKKLIKTQAAAYLGISTRKIGVLVKEGVVEATVDPPDRRWHLILVSSLDEFETAVVRQTIGEGRRAAHGAVREFL